MLEIPREFNRSASPLRDPAAAEESAAFLIRHACDVLGVPDLSGLEVLDAGCGTEFTQAFLNHGIPVKAYVGVDVYADLIECLQENVADPRFDYHHHIDVRNELYNPDALPMTPDTDLGIGDRVFDVIWLLINGTGWKPLELLPPNQYAQHHFVCAPV